MNNKIRTISIFLISLIILGVGCKQAPANNSAPENDSTTSAQEETTKEYNWQEQGLSFKYPAGMFVVKGADDELYINATGQSLPKGEELLLYTYLKISKNTTVKEVVQKYKDDERILKGFSKEKIGDYTFEKIEYEDLVTSEIHRHYILQIRDNVLDYRVGNKNHKGDRDLTLSSLQF